MKRIVTSVLALSLSTALFACSSDDASPGPGGGSSVKDATDGTDAGANGGGPSKTGLSCIDDKTLRLANGRREECRYECSDEGVPHCAELAPSGALAPSMLDVVGAGGVTFTLKDKPFDTATGAVDGLRGPNADPTVLEVKANIGFQLVPIDATHHVAVWMFRRLSIDKGASISFTNANAAAFVVRDEAEIEGVIDLRGYNEEREVCGVDENKNVSAGPGGAVGSYRFELPGGPGAGTAGGSAGGGGYGGAGGAGGANEDGAPGAGGATYGSPTLVPLLGGSAGAGGASGTGGSGGGAFQLVAGKKIVIGNGTTFAGINAGGCAGLAAGAGGSGGAILLETPELELRAKGVLAANGGSGGPGYSGDGVHGLLDAVAATPPDEVNAGYGRAGAGAAASSLAGGAGFFGPIGGAGGGGAGRIRINVRGGSFAVPAGAILSPSLDTPAASIGALQVR